MTIFDLHDYVLILSVLLLLGSVLFLFFTTR